MSKHAWEETSNSVETNAVLRNTFMLLGLTLIPTIFGAWLAMITGINAWVMANPIFGMILFLILGVILIFAVGANSESELGVLFLLLFTGVMGALVSSSIELVLGMKNGHMIVLQAIAGTIIVCFSCGIYAMTTKRDFSSMGGALFGILTALLVVSILNLWLQLPVLSFVLSIVAILLFSVYLIYDVQQVVNGGETNYIIATMQIYLDVMNIFINILSLLASGSVDDD